MGNPATATGQVVFDDENLQQMWDATKFARFPRLTVVHVTALSALANNVEHFTVARNDLFEGAAAGRYSAALEQLGLTPSTADVYLVGYQAQSDLSDQDHVQEMLWGVASWVPGGTGTDPAPITLGYSPVNAVDGTQQLVSGQDNVSRRNDVEQPDDWPGMLPMLLGRRGGDSNPDVLYAMIEANAAGQAVGQIAWKLHFCLAGMPIWYQLI